ncbi:hypothetical protein HA466_0293190 [Hirschfeldia incana]|nr:hypothetical protein HA466_0293190 [Hirschfeldia incana]
MSSSSSVLEPASELVKLFYAAHLTLRENERASMIGKDGESFKTEDLLQIPCVRDYICFPEENGQTKSEQVKIARSTANDYLRDPKKKLPRTDTTYSSIKARVNLILSPEFPYFAYNAIFDYKSKETIGGWDFENCPVPETFTKEEHYKAVFPNIQNGRRNLKFVGPLDVVGMGNTWRLNGYNYLVKEKKIKLFHEVKIGDEEDTSDKGLIVEMRARMDKHLNKYKEPGNILLMTGDIDFLGLINEAKRLGFYVILASNENNYVSPELKKAANRNVQWFKLVEGSV